MSFTSAPRQHSLCCSADLAAQLLSLVLKGNNALSAPTSTIPSGCSYVRPETLATVTIVTGNSLVPFLNYFFPSSFFFLFYMMTSLKYIDFSIAVLLPSLTPSALPSLNSVLPSDLLSQSAPLQTGRKAGSILLNGNP